MKRLLHPGKGTYLVLTVCTLVLFGTLVVISGIFGRLHYMAGASFWTIWVLKNCAVMASIAIPIILGMVNPWQARKSVLILAFYWFGFWIVTALTSTNGPTNTNLYLVRHIGPSLLCFLILLYRGPQFRTWLLRFTITRLRQLVLGLIAVNLLASLSIGTSWLGIQNGQTIVMYFFLFTIGVWLTHDPLINRIRTRLLVPVTSVSFVLAIILSWLTTNTVHYDPHHGLTTTLHYLDGINWNQPLMIISLIGMVTLLQKHWQHQITLDPAALTMMGVPFLWLMMPQVPYWVLGNFLDWNRQFSMVTQLLILLGTSLFITVAVGLITSGILSLYQRIPWPPINWRLALRHMTLSAWRTWLLIGTTWLITVFAIWHLWDWQLNMLQWVILHRESIIFINVLIIVALYAVLMALLNRFWWAAILTQTSYIIWQVVNMIKISDRNEPILPVDTSMVSSLSSIKDLLKLISPSTIVVITLFLVIMLGVTWIVQRHDSQIRWSVPQRATMLLLSVVLLSSFRFANHPDSIAAKGLSSAGDRPYFYSQLRAAKLNGTLLQFANNIDVTIMKQPQGYSKQTMLQLEQRYRSTAQKVNQHRQYQNMANQSVVFVLSESFADPKDVPNLHVNGDPLPYLHQLEQTTTSGKMISSGYGGGTANMEYQALTGLSMTNFSPTLPTPYSQLVPYQKQTFAISNLFNYRVAIHPFTANLYNRKQVYQKLGFNQFYHLQGGHRLSYTSKIQHSPYISDAAAYSQTVMQLKQHVGGQFINLVTMQNHMPFDNYYVHDDYPVSGTAFADPAHRRDIENYIQGIHYTDTALKQFNRQLDQIHKPVTVVWYGDHLPGIYNGDAMHQYGIQLHATDYLIYGNRYSPAYHVKLSKRKVTSPNNFAAMLLEQMNVKVSPYYALLTKVYEDLPALALNSFDGATNNTANGSSEMVDEQGQLVYRLTPYQRQLLHDYQLVQYDLTAGHGYLANQTFMDR